MDRMLQVHVDQSTWPTPPDLPAFPATFAAGSAPFTLNIPGFLLTIGYLTTPSHASGVSLSEFWAWVRYLHAIAADPDLRLTPAFADLDAHQKTILSDDFGMGAPVFWLLDRLQIAAIVDGRYFIDRVAASIGATAAKPAKRGPGKSPDFVARDIHGVWHVLECKGTQGNSTTRKKQLGDIGPPQTGAVAQKRTISFPAGHTGQRLASGLVIGVAGSTQASSLRIIDPPGDEKFVIEQNQLDLADDAIERAALARSLRLAGFGASASIVSTPWGQRPQDRPTRGRAEQVRQAIVREKTARASQELADRSRRLPFAVGSDQFRGREVTFDLPVVLDVGSQQIRAVHVRYGVREEVLDDLAARASFDEPLRTSAASARLIGERMKVSVSLSS
ncbi:hypothetical protein ACFFTN_26400 [Aminobacter aganoensis]|uniref:Uncharacterized protein n=2 Tax=Aminobacter aganoensis TaxID=83264 RepID=A0A7X0FDW8_9HYPH|nr:hypothetical protein [Aminobacter aganoensis]MBB6357920.1 hypothetical protein [Aminobacter aganoensis]